MKIFDTKSGKKVEFALSEKNKIKMYVCGPTVYDVGHLGHGRSAVSFDVIRRYFIYKGFDVKYVSNYTDVDDKMINRAKEEKISVERLAAKIIPEYEEDYAALGIMKPDVQPKATEHINEIIALIKKLDEAGYTYILSDGVYFDVSKFVKYGALSGQNLENLQMGVRVEVNEEKRNPYDFVVWKFKKEGEPFWESPWGLGRPGWHIECSAMTWKHLGEVFDIHGGGQDLIFPHHECEVAQSQAVFGTDKFARYWMHNGFINIDNEKMSKSLGNFFTLKDVFKKYDPQVVRFMFLQTHYRNPINFSDKLLDQAKAGLSRLHDFIRNLRFSYEKLAVGRRGKEKNIENTAKKFEDFMDNDFDTSGALSVIFDLIKDVNLLREKNKLTKSDVDLCEKFLKGVDAVLGIIFPKNEIVVDDGIAILIEKRNAARKNKDFEAADRIRNELLKKGIILEDNSEGTIYKKG